jgi:hypothetical protein
MRSIRTVLAVFLLLFVLSCGIALAQSGTCAGMSLGQGASLNGFVPFQSTSLWNTDISTAQVDANSSNIINFIGSTVTLHPDFGAGTFHNQTLGIPYQIVAGTQAKVPVYAGSVLRRERPGPRTDSGQRPDRRLPKTRQWRPSRARAGKRRLLAL